MYNSHDTIAAIATPAGPGGIAVIRVSGADSFSLADGLFHGNAKAVEALSHTIHYGKIVDPVSQLTIDTALISVFRNPNSYTGEDVIEISTHGGHYITKKVLELIIAAGARLAHPGEFTFRAFLNGKLDLTQAEAVADIIHSKAERSHRSSIEQLNGKLSRYIGSLRMQVLDLCSLLELELDFSQEGIELTQKNDSIGRIQGVENKITTMIESFTIGKLNRNGVKVAIAGRPNAGKSSLLNVLLEEERAIVSDIPGTTRDTIEESIIINGMEYIFIDTAGLRESIDVIEKEGIRRTIQNLQKADIILFIIDCSNQLTDEDVTLFSEAIKALPTNVLPLYVLNKTDCINPGFSISDLPKHEYVKISCKNSYGILELKTLLSTVVSNDLDTSSNLVVITNIRHKNALENSLKSLKMAENSIKNNMSGDFVAADLRDAVNHLGEIIGLTTPDDILNNIFSKFCIGK